MTEVMEATPTTTPTTTPTPPQSSSRTGGGKPSRLCARDVAMMASVSAARYLTAEALEWLHFPGWRARWERHQQGGSRRARYYPSTYTYRRLAFLIEQGWLYRIKRSLQTGTEHFLPEPDAYGILEEGAQLVAGYQHVPLESLSFDRKRPRSFFTLSHSVEIGVFYAALRARLETRPGVQLVEWQSDLLTAREYDRVEVRRVGPSGNMELVKLAIQPDASFVLVHPGGRDQFFVEVDRGTRPTATWTQKIQAYKAYTNSPELLARFGVTTFQVLTVATTEATQQRLMQATASVLGKPNGRYLFTLQGAVHPTTIGQAWTRITSVTPTGQPTRPIITSEAHTFIQ